MHTYIHTSIDRYKHTYLSSPKEELMDANEEESLCGDVYLHTYINANTHIYTHIHTYIYTYIHADLSSPGEEFMDASEEESLCGEA